MGKKKNQVDETEVENPDEVAEVGATEDAAAAPDEVADEGNDGAGSDEVDGGKAETEGGENDGGDAAIIPANFSVVQRFRIVKDGQDKEFVEGDTLTIQDVEFLGPLFDERLANGHIVAKLAV